MVFIQNRHRTEYKISGHGHEGLGCDLGQPQGTRFAVDVRVCGYHSCFKCFSFCFIETLMQDYGVFPAGQMSFLFAVDHRTGIAQTVMSEVGLVFIQPCAKATPSFTIISVVTASAWDLIHDAVG